MKFFETKKTKNILRDIYDDRDNIGVTGLIPPLKAYQVGSMPRVRILKDDN